MSTSSHLNALALARRRQTFPPAGPAPELPRARPTTYRGITMRSRLEAGFATWLDRSHIAWEYEPLVHAGPAGQYLPDFLLHGVHDTLTAQTGAVYVEVKPTLPDDELRRQYHALMAPLDDLAVAVLIQIDGGQIIRWQPGGWTEATWLIGSDGRPSVGALLRDEHAPLTGAWWAA